MRCKPNEAAFDQAPDRQTYQKANVVILARGVYKRARPNPQNGMEEMMDQLRSCLMERLSLNKEITILFFKESDIISPRAYLDCQIRLDAVRTRLRELEREIPQLTAQLRADLINPTALADVPSDDQAPLLAAEQDAPGELPQGADQGGETPAGP